VENTFEETEAELLRYIDDEEAWQEEQEAYAEMEREAERNSRDPVATLGFLQFVAEGGDPELNPVEILALYPKHSHFFYTDKEFGGEGVCVARVRTEDGRKMLVRGSYASYPATRDDPPDCDVDYVEIKRWKLLTQIPSVKKFRKSVYRYADRVRYGSYLRWHTRLRQKTLEAILRALSITGSSFRE